MYLFDYLGAFYFWIAISIIRVIRAQEPPTFKDILSGKNKYNFNDPIDKGAYGIKLKMIGFIVTGIILHLIVKSGI